MSRNLLGTDCACCGLSAVELVESPRPLTKEEAKGYFLELEGLIVANAECSICEAKYIAWVDPSKCAYELFRQKIDLPDEEGFYDLSFRTSFNDEPNEKDLPKYEIISIEKNKKHISNEEIFFQLKIALKPADWNTKDIWWKHYHK